MLGDEEKRFSALGTADLNTDRFRATLPDHVRVISGKRAAAVRTTDFIHFVSSLKIIEQLGRQAGRGRRRWKRLRERRLLDLARMNMIMPFRHIKV